MAGSFREVYAAYGQRVFAYLVRVTGDRAEAEELCQETFLRYLRHERSLREANGSLGPWLYRVATNLFRDSLRRRRPERLATEPPSRTGDSAAAAEARDLGARVAEEVARLPGELREAFLLRAHEELTHAQVAEALGVSVRTAKDRFRRARDLLAARLGDIVSEEQS